MALGAAQEGLAGDVLCIPVVAFQGSSLNGSDLPLGQEILAVRTSLGFGVG